VGERKDSQRCPANYQALPMFQAAKATLHSPELPLPARAAFMGDFKNRRNHESQSCSSI
jgi:hypothetical protein